MTASIAFLHVGDLHAEAADDWRSVAHLRDLVAEANTHLRDLDFAFLPGDDANNGAPAEYAAMLDALAPLRSPWLTIPGDHDLAPGDLSAFHAAIPPANRPDSARIAGHRCILLDIVSAGAGGPDFRLSPRDRVRLRRELLAARAAGEPALVFMHAYPGDLSADADEVAALLAEPGTAFVSTGHTHYNELLNDTCTCYGAVRSTGQIEEDDARPGYAPVCHHDGVPSWRFRRLGAPWPAIQIVSPCDLRLATRSADPVQVPRPGLVPVTARSFGPVPDPLWIALDGRDTGTMRADARGYWRADLPIPDPGLHRIAVHAGPTADSIDVLVRPACDLPFHPPLVAPGRACHAIGAWPEAGLLGTRLGPNRNGRAW